MKDTTQLQISKTSMDMDILQSLPVGKVSLFQEFIVRPDPWITSLERACLPFAKGGQRTGWPQMVRCQRHVCPDVLQGLSQNDRHLLERFSLQMFCGKLLAENRQIRYTIILTRVRRYIEEHCDVIGKDPVGSAGLLEKGCEQLPCPVGACLPQVGMPPATKALFVFPRMSNCWGELPLDL